METNELVRKVKERVEILERAEQTGSETVVLDQLEVLRELLNLAHFDHSGADQKIEALLESDDT